MIPRLSSSCDVLPRHSAANRNDLCEPSVVKLAGVWVLWIMKLLQENRHRCTEMQSGFNTRKWAHNYLVNTTTHKLPYGPVSLFLMPRGSYAGGSQFDEIIVGKGGAGYQWDLNLSEKDARRTSLIQSLQWEDNVSDTSDEASVTTVEDVASDLNEAPEGAAEAILNLVSSFLGVREPAQQFLIMSHSRACLAFSLLKSISIGISNLRFISPIYECCQ